MATAKLFVNGGSQALRIPAQFRLPGKEALIEKRGDALVILPKRRGRKGRAPTLAEWFDRGAVAPADFMQDRDQTTNVVEPPKKLFENMRR